MNIEEKSIAQLRKEFDDATKGMPLWAVLVLQREGVPNGWREDDEKIVTALGNIKEIRRRNRAEMGAAMDAANERLRAHLRAQTEKTRG